MVRHNSNFSAEHLCLACFDVYRCMHPSPHSRGGRQMLIDPHFECVQLGTTPIKDNFCGLERHSSFRYFCRRSPTPNGRFITDAPNLLSTLETSLALMDFTAAHYLAKDLCAHCRNSDTTSVSEPLYRSQCTLQATASRTPCMVVLSLSARGV